MSHQQTSVRSFQVSKLAASRILERAVQSTLEMLEQRQLFAVVPPTAVAGGPYNVAEGSSILITGLGSSDSDGSIATYQWDTNYSGGRGFRPRFTGSTWRYHATDSGTKTIALRVIDNEGNATVQSTTITVADTTPTISFTAPNTAVEGQNFNVTWGYTDPGESDTVNAWNVDWGDGTNSNLAGTATGTSHAYAEDGNFTITLTASQTDGDTAVVHNIAVSNLAPIVTASTTTPTADEGDVVDIRFSSTNRSDTIEGWVVDWGDGEIDTYSRSVHSSLHAYADNGVYTATVSALEPDGGTGSATVTYTIGNVTPEVEITGVPTTGTEGSAISVGSNVNDAGSNDTQVYGWTVYRNGSHYILPGNTVINDTTFSFTPTDNGSYVIRLTVVDNDTGSTTVNSDAIVVANAAPTAQISGTPVGAIDEGDPVNLTVTPADAGSSDTFTYAWSVTKNASAFALPNGTTINAASFGFTPTDNGTYVATVVVTDKDGATVSVSTAAIVADNVAPSATVNGAPATADEGDTVSVTSTVTDPSPLDTFTYSWSVEKDGSPFALPNGTDTHAAAFSFVPTDEGDYMISVAVSDDDAGTVTSSSSTITVANVAPDASITAPTTIAEGASPFFVATATDAGANDALTYLWTVEKDSNPFVLPNGTVDDDSSFSFIPTDNGSYVVTLVVTDDSGAQVTRTHTLAVTNVAPSVAITGVPADSDEGTAVSLGSTVTDAGADDVLTYGWTVYRNGQQFTLPGNAVLNQNNFTFTPTDDGSYVVRLTVLDDDTGTKTVNSDPIIVGNIDPTAVISGEPVGSIDEGDTVNLSVTPADVGSEDTFTYAWSVNKGGSAYALPNGVVTTSDTFSFVPTDNGSYVVTATVTDDNGGTISVHTAAIVVVNVDPVAAITGAPIGNPEEGDTISLGSTVSDVGTQDTVTYAWTVAKNGNPLTLPNNVVTNASTFNFVPTDNGAYIITLVVTDKDGGVDSVTTGTITVNNVAPTGTITGDTTGTEGTAINVGITPADAGSADTHSYAWTVTKDGQAYLPAVTNGLHAEYFNDTTLTNSVLTRIDPNIEFTWGAGSPDASIPNDVFSARWTGKIVPQYTETYSFSGQVDDGIRIWVDNVLVYDAWNDGSGNFNATSTVALNAGVEYDFRVEYYENGGGADITLRWQSNSQQDEVIPQSAFRAIDQGFDADNLTFTPDDNGTYVVSAVVTDDDGDSATVSRTINVVNAAPTVAITGTPSSSNEGTAISVGSTVTDAGVNDTFTYAWTVTKNGNAYTLPGNVNTTNNSFAFTPTDNGSYRISLAVTDNGSSTTTVQSTLITVNNVAPTGSIAGEPVGSIDEGDSVTLTSTATDVGTDDTFTYAWTVTKNGQAYLPGVTTNTSSLTFSPNDNGTFVATLTITDDDGSSVVIHSADIVVDNVAPTGYVQSPSSPSDEGTELSFNSQHDDVGSGDTFTYAWTVTKNGQAYTPTGPSNIYLNRTYFYFTPTDNGNYVATVVITDDDGGSVTEVSDTITVDNVAPAPTITGSSAVNEGSSITLTAAPNDVGSADTHTYSWSVTRNGQAFTLPNGTVTNTAGFTFTSGMTGTYIASVVVTDDDNGSTTQTKTINVANVAPTATITGVPSGPRAEGSDILLTAHPVDVGGDTSFTYAWSVRKNGNLITLPNGTVTNASTFTFSPTDNGSYRVTAAVTDSNGATGSVTTSAITITNALPIATMSDGPVGSITEGTPVTLSVTAEDPGADDTFSYLWSVTKNGSPFTLSGGTVNNAASFTFTPTDNGTYIATCVVTDDDAGPTSVASSAITVTNVAPTADITGEPSQAQLEGLLISLSSSVLDPSSADTQTYAWSVTKNGNAFTLPNGTVTNGNAFSFTPTDNGTYVATLTVTDDDGGTVTVTSDSMTITNANPAGSITGPTTANEGGTVAATATVTDAGSADTHTYSWSVTKGGNAYTLPNGTTTNAASFSFTPIDNGSYVLTCVVNDDDNGTATLTHTVAVANVAPAASIFGESTGDEGDTLDFSLSVLDVGADDTHTYTWSVTRGGSPVTLPGGTDIHGTEFSFVTDDNGTYVVNCTITDDDAGTVTAGQNVLIANVAPSVAINSAPAHVDEDSTTTLTSTVTDVSSADTDAGFTYLWTVKRGETTVATGTDSDFDFTPDIHGIYTVTLAATDKNSGTTTTSATTITVDNVAPTGAEIDGMPSSMSENEVATLSGSASDAPAETLTYSWSVSRNGSPFATASGPSFEFSPHVRGNFQVTLTATDTSGATTTATETIAVANVAPEATITVPSAPLLLGEVANFGLAIDDVPLNQALTVTWDFGDGTTATASYVGDQSSITTSHTYATDGVYNVTATVNDGIDTKTVLGSVAVSRAAVRTDPFDSSKTSLIVYGTANADTIVVEPSQTVNRWRVTLNGQVLGTTFAPTANAVIYGNAGANNITVNGGINAVVFAGGSTGASVTTGSGNDLIFGTSAADAITGGAGRDIIIGGAGRDTLRGGESEDVVVADGVNWANKPASIKVALDTWASSKVLAGRITDLKATGLFSGTKLIADTASDQLYGEARGDWFVLNSAVDRINDWQAAFDVSN